MKTNVFKVAILAITALLLAGCAALATPTRDPLLDTLATGQAQVAEALVELQAQVVQPIVSTSEVGVEPGEVEETPTSEVGDLDKNENVLVQSTTGGWEITRFDLDNDPIVEGWLSRLREPAPELWQVFPNVPNSDVADFDVANGAEYGQDDSPFCEQDQRCDWVVPAWHYRLISGDYSFNSPDFSYECRSAEGQPRKGCLIVLFNVMDNTHTWRDQSVDNGFTVMGRYWNGDNLEWAAWGLTSHASANMLNMATMRNPNAGDVLNAGGNFSNAGANCGVQPDACSLVDVTIIVHAGDRILAVAQTTVSR